MDASFIQYTSIPLTHINVTPNMDLETILLRIDTAINSSSSAPNYSGYNLSCVTQTDGTSHPTNTQNFAEGISKILCNLSTAYTTFSGTTYPAAIATLTNGINSLQVPGITYATFSITSTDTLVQVLNKTFTGTTNIINSIKPDSANWGTLGASTQTSIVTAFNTVIAYASGLNTAIGTKEASIGTFNNSSNCISGTSTDTPRNTILGIITYLCSLPTLNTSGYTWGVVSTSSTLNGTLQNIISQVSSQAINGVVSNGTGLSMTSVGTTYQGKRLSIDTSWDGLYKAKTDVTDSSPNFLENKFDSTDGSITLSTSSGVIDLSVTTPNDNKVKATNSDSSAGVLISKLTSAADSSGFGLSISVTPSVDNSQVVLTPSIITGSFASSLMNALASDPTLFAQFSALVASTTSMSCAPPTALTVTYNNGTDHFVLSWTPSGSATSQKSKWRIKGQSTWVDNSGISPVNPHDNSVSTSQVIGTGLRNKVVQFQVDSVCSGAGVNNSNLYEYVGYEGTAIDTSVVGGVISYNQPPLSLDTIQYRLKNGGGTVIQNQSKTGASPQGSFTSVASGNYTVEWRFGTLVNGITIYSDDASQLNAWLSSTTITVP